jgi:DNA-binding transcriptional regulator YiaG
LHAILLDFGSRIADYEVAPFCEEAWKNEGRCPMAVVVRGTTAAKKLHHSKAKLAERPVRIAATSVKPGLVVDLRKRLQLNQSVFARLLPVSVRSLATLESGAAPTEVVARRLIELQRLTNALSEVIKEESLGNWLQTPNEAFGGLKPLEVIDRGESDRIWSMIYFLRSGVPS